MRTEAKFLSSSITKFCCIISSGGFLPWSNQETKLVQRQNGFHYTGNEGLIGHLSSGFSTQKSVNSPVITVGRC